MQKIIPNIWFNTNAAEAVAFYTSVFKNGKTKGKTYYTEAGNEIHGMSAGSVLTIDFQIEDIRMVALNGGPHFSLTPAISFMVRASSVAEVDGLWQQLSAGGKTLMPLDEYPFSKRYGWIEDRFGVSWQIMVRDDAGGPTIVPSLLFTGQVAGKAEEAIGFYTSVFKHAEPGIVARYGNDQAPDVPGALMYADFTLEGQLFAAMDSARSHDFVFNEALSFIIECKDQEEIDYYWEKLSANPASEQCGWLKDKYGVSWQVTPVVLNEMLANPDKGNVDRCMDALLRMKKLDIQKLTHAYQTPTTKN